MDFNNFLASSINFLFDFISSLNLEVFHLILMITDYGLMFKSELLNSFLWQEIVENDVPCSISWFKWEKFYFQYF